MVVGLFFVAGLPIKEGSQRYGVAMAWTLYLNFLLLTHVIYEGIMFWPYRHRGVFYKMEPGNICLDNENITKYAVEDNFVEDRLCFNRQDTLCLDRIIFAWNQAYLTRKNNDKKVHNQIRDSLRLEDTPGPIHSHHLSEDEDGSLIGCGLGPIKGNATYLVVAWYDDQIEWPSLSLPQRIVETRPEAGRHQQTWWSNYGKYLAMDHPDEGIAGGEPGEIADQNMRAARKEITCHVHATHLFDTKAYMFELEQCICISFMGSNKLTHYLTDSMVGQELLEEFSTAEAPEYVHIGFHHAFLSMRDQIEWWLGAHPDRIGKPVLLCGHSLGGALATLCARYISELPAYQGHPEKLGTVTFGSPCVGNRHFAKACHKNVGEMWRFVCESDIVPSAMHHSNMALESILMFFCCGVCLLTCCPKRAQAMACKFGWGSDRTYKHTGKKVLVSHEGVMMVTPAYSIDLYMRKARQVLRRDKSFFKHHESSYEQAVKMWIHAIHPEMDEDLLSKFIVDVPEIGGHPGKPSLMDYKH